MPRHPTRPASHGRARAWGVVGGLFLMLMASAGLGFYGLSVYLSVLSQQRSFSVSALSGATAVFFVVSGLAGVVCARLLQRVDPRVIMISGALIAAASLIGIGRVTRLAEIYGAYALFGIGYAATSFIISTTLVTRWFDAHRALALSIASTGVSIGGVALTPVARHLLDARALPGATARIAVVYVVCVIAASALVHPDPSRFGLGTDGITLPAVGDDGPHATAHSGTPFAPAVRSSLFAGLTATFVLALGAQVGAIAQLDKVAHERLPDGAASPMVSILAACAVIGRLSGSAVSHRFRPRAFTSTLLVLQAIALTGMALARTTVPFTLATVLFGLVLSNVLLAHPLLLASAFGVRDYPRIYGRSQALVTIGVAAGPFVFGWLRDHAGGYAASYASGSFLSVAALTVYLARGSSAELPSTRRGPISSR